MEGIKKLEGSDGLTILGNVNLFALSEVFVENFSFEADISISKGMALSLTFGADKYLCRYHCMNIDLAHQCFKL